MKAEKLSTFEPTRHRNRPEALGTGVRPYERTCLPARRPEPTNWCHGSPAEHAWSLLARGQPPSSPDGRGRPNRQSSPLMATFLMLSRSREATGRVRATPGALSTAGRPRWTDGLNPRGGQGVKATESERAPLKGQGPGLVNVLWVSAQCHRVCGPMGAVSHKTRTFRIHGCGF